MKGAYGVRLERSTPLQLERHPDAPKRQSWRAWAKEQASNGPIAVDLFSGAGGLSLGLEKAGYTVVLSVDHDEAAVKTHLANFPGAALAMDLSDPDRVDDLLELLSDLDLDLVAGGPPCQPFSRAGRSKIRDLVDRGVRDGIDPRRELWRVLLRVAEETKPRAVLMENVPDMALGDDMRAVRLMADRLEAIGYDTDMRILEAWRYGVPQHRQRLIFVALSGGVLEWPKDRDTVTLRDAINDLPSLGTTTGKQVARYRGPRTEFQREARASVPEDESNQIHDHVTRPVREDDRLAFRLMRKGTRYSDLPEHLKRYRDDIFDDKYNRLDWDDWCRSITAHIAKDGYWYIHPQQHRTLTVREAARIQTFPDSFRFAGTRSDAFRLIGNAVPPRLGEVVASELLSARERRTPSAEMRPARQRAAVRRALVSWATEREQPAWRRTGDPWAVLVGVIAGRRQRDLGESLLSRYPTPEAVTGESTSTYPTGPETRNDRRVAALARAAGALVNGEWESSDWAVASGIAGSAARWVETVGLGRKHVAATAGTLRVATRLAGHPGTTGVPARMLLAQVIGHGDQSNEVAAALAGLAEEICLPRSANCPECPLRTQCVSADTPAVRPA